MRIKRISRAVATLLLLVLLFSMSPVQAFADDTGQDAASTVTEDAGTAETEATAPTETAEPQEARSPDPDTAAADGRYPGAFSLGYHLWRSNTVQSGWGGIYPARGAGSLSYSWTRNDGTTAYKTLAAAGDTEGVGMVHYMPYTDDNDPLASVYSAEVAYCIEPDKLTVNCQMYDWQSESSSEILSSLLSQEKIKAVKLACAYGWPYGFSDAYGTSEETAFKRQYATQIIVWEIIMDLRGSSGTYAVTDPSLKNHYWGDPWSSYYGSTNDAFKAAYDEINARLARHNIYPSFAASTAAGAPVHSMTYNSATGKYTITLTDSNGVLSPDFDSFDQPSGVAVTKNGNTLTITATEAAMASGEVTVSMKGKKKEAGTAYIWTADYRQTLASISDARAVPAFFKLKADTKTISLKKTSSASASVMACIQGNPRYSLGGAVYEIRQVSATGPVVETLTTDANGNATGTGKYAVGTELYAIEKTAPAGYLLNATPVKLTVSADSSQNVFNVSDTPTFDPARLGIMKTGTDSERIAGTIFKADFYASTWMDANYLQRTWYLKSDSTGLVQFDDAHLLSSYDGHNSDPLFKPDGQVQFPLGCIYIQEIQAAEGYITPVGNDGGVLIFIDPDSSGKAVAYWGDAAGKPITTQNPKGIFRMENDSDGTVIMATNQPVYGAPFSVKKIDPSDVPLENAIFRVEYFDAASVTGSATASRTWYFCTAADGFFTLDAAHLVTTSEYPSDELYPTDKIPLGIMRVQELQAPTGFTKNGFVGYWRMKQESSGSSTVLSYWAAADGDTPATGYGDDAYILDADPTLLYVRNRPINELEIVKTSSNGRIDGINFTVERYNPDTGKWVSLGTSKYFTTDTNGKINISNLTVGTRLRVTEIVPDGSICLSENPQILTLKAGKNTVNFENVDISLEIAKTSSNGRIDGIRFVVEKRSGSSWQNLGTYTTNTDGKIQIETTHLAVGAQFRIREIVPAGSLCLSENPQILTLTAGKNTVNFENVDISLEIVKNATDGHNSGIPFEVEKKNGESWTMLGTYTTGLDGKIAIETQHLAVGAQIRIKEIVPANYICVGQNPKIVTLAAGTNTVEFINKPSGDLEIIKTSTDGQVEGIGFLVEIFDRESETWNLIRSQLGELWITDSTGKIHIPGIEVGSRLRISEDVPANYICLSENPQIITIVQGTNAVSFENQPLDGSISVFKENADGTPMQGVKFILEYSVDSGASWAPVQQRSSDDPIQTGFCTSANIVNGCITTGEDGSAVFTGLAISTELNHVTYRLTEIKTQNGQSLLAAPVFEGSLTADQRDLTFYAVNASTFRLPMTGSSGFTVSMLGLALSLLAALFILFNLPRKKEEK